MLVHVIDKKKKDYYVKEKYKSGVGINGRGWLCEKNGCKFHYDKLM